MGGWLTIKILLASNCHKKRCLHVSVGVKVIDRSTVETFSNGLKIVSTTGYIMCVVSYFGFPVCVLEGWQGI